MKKEIINIGYLSATNRKSSRATFKERSNDAIKIRVRLCLIEMTQENLEAIREERDIKVRIWKNNSFLEEISIPVPVVIYDRTPVGNSTSKTDLFIEALIYAGCKFLNSPEVRMMARDKWAQFKFFATRGVRIPQTAKYTVSELTSFLKKGLVFIKPRSGSEGKNQIIIKKIAGESKTLPVFEITSTFSKKFQIVVSGIKEVQKYLLNFTLSPETYIIQEGVAIDRLEEEIGTKKRTRSFDFRVIVQRTTSSNPVVTICFIRVGPSRSDQANISQGGHPQDIESVFENHQEVTDSLKLEAIGIFNLLAESYTVSEMAFDFVSDKEGNYWFIEMNSRPGTKGPRTLREWVPADKLYARKGVILFDEDYSNKRRQKWGARFLAFRILPFYYGRTLSQKG
jgi:hypothetical protein